MRELLDAKLNLFEQLERELVDPAIMADAQRMAAVVREHGLLARLVTRYRRYLELCNQIADAVALRDGTDADLRELAAVELPELQRERDIVWDDLVDLTVAGDDASRPRCVLEIRAGTGGDEAALFARDLFKMYKMYCESKGWTVELLSRNATELGGFKEICLGLTGAGAYRELQYESGGHRVQRVPETEAKGRIHTSAATVAVMPEPEDIEVDLRPDEYRKDIYHASGPGGQHVNKTASAVRLTHFETGIVVAIQDEKSQHKNLAKALRVLKTRLYEAKRKNEQQKRAQERKSLVGSGDRSQRIRTYNFPENRVTDHRINLTLYKLDQILAGNLQPIVTALIDYQRQRLRDAMGATG
jgi:peptide chain release factor 1